jgi:hypothetical protein
LLRQIGEKLGIKDAAVIEITVRRMAEQEQVAIASKPTKRQKE